ncbi:MAG: hypothetical protein KC560_11770, partial [Myxococcales bacterium]|nr:hypothetical protein [Myxococcales bacterium]
HWAHPADALPELRRALAPGAWLTVLWNDRRNDACPATEWVEAAIRRYAPGWDEAYRDRDWAEVLRSTGDFEAVELDEHDHVVPMPRERFVRLWRSHNRLKAAVGDDGLERLLAELETYLDDRRVELVELPYRARAWSARRV